jgi:hypothetical protein
MEVEIMKPLLETTPALLGMSVSGAVACAGSPADYYPYHARE